MRSQTFLGGLLALLIAALGIIAVSGKYTRGMRGNAAYFALADGINRALGKPVDADVALLPDSLFPQGTDSPRTPTAAPSPGLEAGGSASIANPSRGMSWLSQVARTHRQLLEGWVDPSTSFTRQSHDTVYVTLWKLVVNGSCPLVSYLKATTVVQGNGAIAIEDIASNCPKGADS